MRRLGRLLNQPPPKGGGNRIRLVELKLTWPVGKYQESFEVRSFMTKQDFSLAPNTGGIPDLSNIDPTKVPDALNVKLPGNITR